MKKEMELELQLKEAQNAYGMLFDQKVAARTTVIALMRLIRLLLRKVLD